MESTIIHNASDCIAAIGICGLVGYEPEVNHVIGTCKDARTDFNLLQTISSIHGHHYRNNRKHRLMYACMTGNDTWFKSVFDVSNHNDVPSLVTKYNETLVQLLFGSYYSQDYRTLPRRGKTLSYRPSLSFDKKSKNSGASFAVTIRNLHRSSSMMEQSNESPYTIVQSSSILKIFHLLVENTRVDLNLRLNINYSSISDPIVIPFDGYTLPMLAVEFGHDELMHELISKFANQIKWNYRSTKEGSTALHIASKNGRTEIVRALSCLPDIDLNVLDYQNYSPLIIACRNSRTDTIRELFSLLKYDTDSDRLEALKKSPRGITELKTMFLCACQYGLIDIVRIFCRLPWFNLDCHIKDPDDNPETDDHFDELFHIPSGFIIAAQNGRLSVVEELLKYTDRIDINRNDSSYGTALFAASKNNQLEIVKKLCKVETIDFHLSVSYQGTPLSVAVANGFVEIVDELLKNSDRLNINHYDESGETALHVACASDAEFALEILQRLLKEKNIDFNRPDSSGCTPLCKVVKCGKTELIRELLKYHDRFHDINHQDNRDGSTILFDAIDRIAATILELDVLQLLCTIEKVDLNVKNHNGDTVLITATRYGCSEIVEELLYHYPDRLTCLNEQNSKGQTALHIACSTYNLEIVQYVCALEETDLDMEDNQGNTPFLIAAAKGSIEIVDELLEYIDYIDINHQNLNDQTALNLAYDNNFPNMVQHLRSIEGIDVRLAGMKPYPQFTIATFITDP